MNINQALSILKKKGYKYTGKREQMVQVFQKQGRYLTAKELLDYLQVDFPGLSFDTVYRNLSLFEKLNIVETTEWNGERRFRLHCDDEHHHHLICTSCGSTQTVKNCPMQTLFNQPDNFEITGHKFEIYGICGSCTHPEQVTT